jgi:hypothetical protein
MPNDIQEIIAELRRLPLIGTVTMKGEYLCRVLTYSVS